MVLAVARSSDTYSPGETQCEYVYMTHIERHLHLGICPPLHRRKNGDFRHHSHRDVDTTE